MEGLARRGYFEVRAAALEDGIAASTAVDGPYDFGACWPQPPSIAKDAFLHESGAANDSEGERQASELSLEGVTERPRSALFVVFEKLDRLIPWHQAGRLAAEEPNSRFDLFPAGDQVCNNIPDQYRPLVAGSMTEQLGGA